MAATKAPTAGNFLQGGAHCPAAGVEFTARSFWPGGQGKAPLFRAVLTNHSMAGARAGPFPPRAGLPRQTTSSLRLLTEAAEAWSGLRRSSFPGCGVGLAEADFPTQFTSSHGHSPFHQASCPSFSISASVSWRTWLIPADCQPKS